MKATVSKIVVSRLDGTRWRVEEDVVCQFAGTAIRIHAGEITDFASVPRWLKPLFPSAAIYSAAALVHDHLYSTGSVSKWMADAIFAELLDEAEMKKVGLVMWLAVALFGWRAWNGHRRSKK